jgi:1-acyl-sn-glycerol-3-phosphate acyltransferase
MDLPSPAQLVRKAQFPLRAPTVPGGVEPPPKKRTLGAEYDTDWARRYPARAARVLLVEGLMRPTAHLLARPLVSGRDRLDTLEGPAIFAANHHSHVDTGLLLSVIPEPWQHRIVVGAAADYFFGNRVSAALSALMIGAIPIERKQVGRRSAAEARRLIEDGWSVLLYPEGGRSPDGWGQPFRGGAAYLAIKCGVPVVPIHLEGTGRILRKGKTLPQPSSTMVTFGAPVRPHEGEDSRRFAARLEAEVAALADEATTDWWQARRRAHAGQSPSLTGPQAGAWRRIWALGDQEPKRRRERRSWPELR